LKINILYILIFNELLKKLIKIFFKKMATFNQVSLSTQKADKISRGTLHTSRTIIYTYRTKNGQAYYQFCYADLGNYWEIDLELQPSYNGRSTDPNTVHRLSSSRSATGYKICLSSGKEPRSLEAAKKLSMAWAELTQKYIETGKTLDAQIAEGY
jgi:hypothetical protein